MKRAPLLAACVVALLILLGNVWLQHELTVIERISVDAPRPLWAEVLFFITTVPQFLSLFITRMVVDTATLSAVAWVLVMTGVSVLFYGPLTYYLCRWRQSRRSS
jgi:hypothetical protein